MNDMSTTQEIEKEVEVFKEKYAASDHDSATLWLRTALTHIAEVARAEERERILRQDIRDLQAILDEGHVTDEWRMSEVQAIIYLKGRELMALDATPLPASNEKEV